MLPHFLSHILPFLSYFGVCALLTVGFVFAYEAITPYREFQLIREGNTAASITLTGALLGFAIALAGVVEHAVSLPDLVMWGLLAAVIQLLVWGLLRIFEKDLVRKIVNNEIPSAITLAAFSIAAGYLNNACMTP